MKNYIFMLLFLSFECLCTNGKGMHPNLMRDSKAEVGMLSQVEIADLKAANDVMRRQRDDALMQIETLQTKIRVAECSAKVNRWQRDAIIYLGCAYSVVDELTGPTMVGEFLNRASEAFGQQIVDEYQKWLNENGLPQPGSGADDEFVDMWKALELFKRVTPPSEIIALRDQDSVFDSEQNI